MYQAPIVALVIAASYFYRNITRSIEAKGGSIPLWAQYYVVLYLLILVLALTATNTLYNDVLTEVKWLDDDSVYQFVKDVMQGPTQNDRLNFDESFKVWQEEADLKHFPFLKYLAMSTPIWCLLCFIVCAMHTWDHVKSVKTKNGGKLSKAYSGAFCWTFKGARNFRDFGLHHQPDVGPVKYGDLLKIHEKTANDQDMQRLHEKFPGYFIPHRATLWNDCIILILVLPAIYGLMSFKSVIRSLQIYINHVPAATADAHSTKYFSYAERKGFLEEMWEANFAVGDIMETVALVTFGELISDYLNKQMAKTKSDMIRKELEPEDISTLEAAIKTVSGLTVAGVQLFCIACLLSGGYDLLITTMPAYFPTVAPSLFSTAINNTTLSTVGSLQREASRASAAQFFLGFSFAASFAAIGNIMTLEGNYHEFLEKFKPSKKFWGTKILVTLACVQQCILGLLSHAGWGKCQINLLYASLLTVECFLIAIFHYQAWGAKEEWMDEQHEDHVHTRRSSRGLQEGLLA